MSRRCDRDPEPLARLHPQQIQINRNLARPNREGADTLRRNRREPRLNFQPYSFGLGGTFSPFLRASERPIAMACLRLVTFSPLRPLLSLPSCISCISRSTCLPAPLLYLRPELFFEEDFFVELFFAEVRFAADFLLVLFLLEDFLL